MLTETLSTHPEMMFLQTIMSALPWGQVENDSGDIHRAQINALRPRWSDHAARMAEPQAFLEDVERLNSGRSVWGFKHHLRPKEDAPTKLVVDLRWPAILLSRENELACYSSARIAKATGQGRVAAGENVIAAKVPFVRDEFQKFSARRRKAMRFWERQIERSAPSLLRVTYSQIRRSEGLRSVVAYLGCDPELIGDPTTAKRNGDDVIARFSNPGAVERFIKAKGLERWAREE